MMGGTSQLRTLNCKLKSQHSHSLFLCSWTNVSPHSPLCILTWGWGTSKLQLAVFIQGLSEILNMYSACTGRAQSWWLKKDYQRYWELTGKTHVALSCDHFNGEKMMKSLDSLLELLISCTEWTLKSAKWAGVGWTVLHLLLTCWLLDVRDLFQIKMIPVTLRCWDSSVLEVWSTSRIHCEFAEFRVLQYPYTACLGRCFMLKLIRACLIPALL